MRKREDEDLVQWQELIDASERGWGGSKVGQD